MKFVVECLFFKVCNQFTFLGKYDVSKEEQQRYAELVFLVRTFLIVISFTI